MTLIQKLGFISYDHYWESKQMLNIDYHLLHDNVWRLHGNAVVFVTR